MATDLTNSVLLTSKQLEHRLDVSPMTIWAWRRADNPAHVPLPSVTVSGVKQGAGYPVRFPLQEVANWLVEYKPTIAYRLLEDNCSCRHCTKMRKLAETVENVQAEQTA